MPAGDALRLVCSELTEAAVIDNGLGIENEEHGYPILLCLHPEKPLGTVWDRVRHYS